MMDRPASRVEFQTKDYPDGLNVYVDGRFVYGGGPVRIQSQPRCIYGNDDCPVCLPQKAERADETRFRVSVKCDCGRTHPSLEDWRKCDAPRQPQKYWYEPIDGLVTDELRG